MDNLFLKNVGPPLIVDRPLARFRHGQPRSREDRQQMASGIGEEPVPFWWMSHSSSPPTTWKSQEGGALKMGHCLQQKHFIPTKCAYKYLHFNTTPLHLETSVFIKCLGSLHLCNLI
uniref:Uncharacterized protein n=1 Tax=Amphiprion ocellaris TaxID=80972 RepID=A0AAQ5ZVS2_AMPOC